MVNHSKYSVNYFIVSTLNMEVKKSIYYDFENSRQRIDDMLNTSGEYERGSGDRYMNHPY